MRAAYEAFLVKVKRDEREKYPAHFYLEQREESFRRAGLVACSSQPQLIHHDFAAINSWSVCSGAVRSMPEFYDAFACKFDVAIQPRGICMPFN